jgi:carbon-monoxide dehydrogenase medium subunit
VSRKAGDFALAGCAAAVTVDGSGAVSAARVVLFGVADRPVRSPGAEQALAGSALADAAVRAAAGQAASAEVEAKDDAHASGAYRRDVAGVMVRRALEAAAREGGTQ